MIDSILIVDDEASVRRTFVEWVRRGFPEAVVQEAADAEAALLAANQSSIDVAVLDWNLGAGSHGLQLLEDLHVFQPDLVAILVTGYADKATPLDALRLGVRDFYDKNQSLTEEMFTAALRRQLERIRPLKRERVVQKQLQSFRTAVEHALPFVHTAAAIRDSIPLTESVRAYFDLLLRATHAARGLLIIRHYADAANQSEQLIAIDSAGVPIATDAMLFSDSLAALTACQHPHALQADLTSLSRQAGVTLLPMEVQHRCILAQSVMIGHNTTVVVELFDQVNNSESGAFVASSQAILQASLPLLAHLLKHSFQSQESHALLLDALGEALHSTKQMEDVLTAESVQAMSNHAHAEVVQSVFSCIPRADLQQMASHLEKMVEKHGSIAFQFLLNMLQETEKLLDQATGYCEGR